jgi:hypothetical protein
MFYSGDELYDDEITSGPIEDEREEPDFAEDGWEHDAQERRS